jgi:excinuclease UvrABC helicase subunit UvrB
MNLLNTLSNELQAKLNDFNVSSVTVEYNEVSTRSEYDLDMSFYTAIENELIALGHNIEA